MDPEHSPWKIINKILNNLVLIQRELVDLQKIIPQTGTALYVAADLGEAGRKGESVKGGQRCIGSSDFSVEGSVGCQNQDMAWGVITTPQRS